MTALRAQIVGLCPEAVEAISYGMPAYKYLGKPLVYFGAAKQHVALYGDNARLLSSDELEGLDHAQGTIRSTPDRPLAPTLVQKIVVQARMAEIGQGR